MARALLIICVMTAVAFAGPTSTPAIKMQAPVEFANAGISLAAPAGFEYQPTTELYDVARAVLTEGENKAVQAVSLTVYPINDKATAKQFADEMTAQAQKNIAISGFIVLKEATMNVAGADAQVRLASYVYRGAKTVAARAFFIREEKVGNAAVRLCYALTVESSADKLSSLMPIFAEVLKSVRLTNIQRPIDMPLGDLGAPMKEYRLGYAICPPKNWYVSLTPSGAEIGQTDYTVGGFPMPLVRVIVGDAIGQPTAKDVAHKAMDNFKKGVASTNQDFKVISEGPIKLAGRDGYQFVIELMPSQIKISTTRPADEAMPTIVIQRTVVEAGTAGGEPKSYSLRLYCQTSKLKSADAVLDKIAGGLSIMTAATAPASAPAATQK